MKTLHSYIQTHICKYENEEWKFLLLQRAENLKVYPSAWQVVTGKVEESELAYSAAIREVKEETNLNPIKMWTIPYITKFYEPKRNAIQLCPVFGIEVSSNSIVELSREHQNFKWLSLNEFNIQAFLPSHIEANDIFFNFVLSKTNNSIFQIDLNAI